MPPDLTECYAGPLMWRKTTPLFGTALLLCLSLSAELFADGPPTATQADRLFAIAVEEDRRLPDGAWLIPYFSDPDVAVQLRALVAASRLQQEEHVSAITPLLDHDDAEIRIRAFFALGQIGSETAAAAISDALNREAESTVLSEGLKAAGKIGGDRSAALAGARLADDDPFIRREALLALSRMADSTAALVIIPLLDDSNPEVRAAAAYGLEQIGARDQADHLSALYQDGDYRVREFAVRAAGKLESGSAVLAGAFLLDDESWHVRVNAVRALGEAGGVAASPHLERALLDSSLHVRAAALEAIAAIGEGEVEALSAFLLSEEPSLRRRAAVALVAVMGVEATEVIELALRDEHGPVREGAYGAIVGACNAEQLEQYLPLYLGSSDLWLRKGIVSGFEENDVTPIPFLRAGLRSRDWATAVIAASAIGEKGTTEDLSFLIERFESTGDDSHGEGELRAEIVKAAWAVAPENAIDFVRVALGDPDPRVSAAARTALSEQDGPLDAGPIETDLRVPSDYPNAGTLIAEVRLDRVLFRIDLLGDEAPLTVQNFVRLADSGYYEGIRFHRVVPNFVAQAGCPRGDGWGDPGYSIRCEYNPVRYDRGVVGMALSGKDTGGSQFFITHTPQPHLDGRYTVFGRVRSGMDVVDRIMEGDRILSIRLVRE